MWYSATIWSNPAVTWHNNILSTTFKPWAHLQASVLSEHKLCLSYLPLSPFCLLSSSPILESSLISQSTCLLYPHFHLSACAQAGHFTCSWPFCTSPLCWPISPLVPKSKWSPGLCQTLPYYKLLWKNIIMDSSSVSWPPFLQEPI